ncbi:MAG: hypothetical protein ISR54_07670 [Chlorobium phaeobacteroides]|uniref:Antitoxin-like ribbon-helix-helix domain-containing protein n=1 Tax=Chlorobium phaeobacteroides (strain BS1) TaxID=331678 RepID=B3ENB0_CHLPB|nr:hypothetical protein [Chlorobium phaeobacteroides]MBL6956674.1 hypothetical protein [Chlorobium phaeobacteroides]
MKKKSTLADALLQQSSPAKRQEKAASRLSTSQSYVAPVRRGKKAVTGWFEPDVVRQLKLLGIEQNTTIQDLMKESLNDLFVKYKKAQIA